MTCHVRTNHNAGRIQITRTLLMHDVNTSPDISCHFPDKASGYRDHMIMHCVKDDSSWTRHFPELMVCLPVWVINWNLNESNIRFYWQQHVLLMFGKSFPRCIWQLFQPLTRFHFDSSSLYIFIENTKHATWDPIPTLYPCLKLDLSTDDWIKPCRKSL